MRKMLQNFFSPRPRARYSRRMRTAPKAIQHEIMAKAQAKRDRKLIRFSCTDGASGWYNG